MHDLKEKLVELLRGGIAYHTKLKEDWIIGGKVCEEPTLFGSFADHLIANGVTIQEWISVDDERKPKDRRNYFIAYVFGDSNMHFYGEAMYHAYEGNGVVDRPHFSNEGVNEMRVTHWMEIPRLPQPPKGE